MEADREFFVKTVLAWGQRHVRKFPWRGERDPWRVLIAEILLQRTTPGHVVKVYEDFIRKFPDPFSLARASREEVEKVILPLGMVKRAGTLVKMAQVICKRYRGQVPNNVEDLMRLPGVGRYTAHGVLCLAYGRPVPMIDINSARVLRRYFGLPSDKKPKRDERLWAFAASLVPVEKPALFNLALLDLGAIICRDRKPECERCPLSRKCLHHVSQMRGYEVEVPSSLSI